MQYKLIKDGQCIILDASELIAIADYVKEHNAKEDIRYMADTEDPYSELAITDDDIEDIYSYYSEQDHEQLHDEQVLNAIQVWYDDQILEGRFEEDEEC